MLERATALKIFEYLPLGKELKKETSIAAKQYQSFDKVFVDDEKEEPVKFEKEEPLTSVESSLIYKSKHSSSEFKNAENNENESLVSRYYNYFTPFKQRLKEFKKFTPQTVKTKKNKKIVYNNARKLYSKNY